MIYYLDPDPATWGESCPDSIARRANEILAEMIEQEFPGVDVIVKARRNVQAISNDIDDWVTENYMEALNRAVG